MHMYSSLVIEILYYHIPTIRNGPELLYINITVTNWAASYNSSDSKIPNYHIAQNFDRGNFDIFDAFQLDRQN